MNERITEDKMIFAASCVEEVAKAMGATPKSMYERMKRVDLINGYILEYYDTLHSESRENVTKEIIKVLLNWEDSARKEGIL